MKDFDLLYEDKDILVINKPAGVLVHPDSSGSFSVSDWVAEKYPESCEVGESQTLANGQTVQRPGIVHRLDRDTSGALLIAKTTTAYEALKKQFQEREVEKEYRVFVYGKMKDAKGIIDRSIGRSSSDFKKWSAERGSRGERREAMTEYKVLKAEKDFSYVEAYPKTGRTHQIRVHFKAISHPVISDSLYAPRRAPLLGFKRQALHAYRLTFANLAGEKVTVNAPFPDDFLAAFKESGIAL